MNMKHVKRTLTLVLALTLVLGLAACGPAGPDMPMEVSVEGHTIVLGQTTMSDLTKLGWTAKLTGAQREIRKNDKYVAFHYNLAVDGGGAGKELWASVYVPFQGHISGNNADISQEQALAGTQGVVCMVSVRKSAGKDLSISYNGTDLQDITWDTAKEWGATVKEGEYVTSAELAAAQGTLSFAESSTNDGEFNELTVTMDAKAFDTLQK